MPQKIEIDPRAWNRAWGGATLMIRSDARFVGMEKLRRSLTRCAVKRALGEQALISKGLAVKLEKEGLLASVNALLERMEAAAGAAVGDG